MTEKEKIEAAWKEGLEIEQLFGLPGMRTMFEYAWKASRQHFTNDQRFASGCNAVRAEVSPYIDQIRGIVEQQQQSAVLLLEAAPSPETHALLDSCVAILKVLDTIKDKVRIGGTKTEILPPAESY